MRSLGMLGVGALLCLTTNARAAGADASEAKDKPAAKHDSGEHDADQDKDEDFGHRRQFGLRVGALGGYRMAFRYDNSPYCNEPDPKKAPKDQQKFCGFSAPLTLDVGASFAVLDGLEPFLWGRFGLQPENKTDTKPQVLVGVGARIYTMSDSAFKIFIEPAVAYEFEGGRGTRPAPYNDKEYKKDLVFHLAAGPQLDVAKYFGVYLDAGLTTGVIRAIGSTMELQLGIQLRAP